MTGGSRFQNRGASSSSSSSSSSAALFENDSETLAGGGESSDFESRRMEWTAALACRSGALFVAAAAFEILGGWLVWQFVREKRSIWFLVLGFVVLMIYGVIPCYQPLDDFGRTYAAYVRPKSSKG